MYDPRITVKIDRQVYNALSELKHENCLASVNEVLRAILKMPSLRPVRYNGLKERYASKNHSWPWKNMEVGQTIRIPLNELLNTSFNWSNSLAAYQYRTGKSFKSTFVGYPDQADNGATITRVS